MCDEVTSHLSDLAMAKKGMITKYISVLRTENTFKTVASLIHIKFTFLFKSSVKIGISLKIEIYLSLKVSNKLQYIEENIIYWHKTPYRHSGVVILFTSYFLSHSFRKQNIGYI